MWRHAAGARLKLGLTWMMLAGAALMELLSSWLGAQALNELQKSGTQALSTAACYGAAIRLLIACHYAYLHAKLCNPQYRSRFGATSDA